ncbi:MAG: hypothetical protein KAJ78_01060 [Acidobacteria bacterium]|nr:hypothetical protein [Acidobacteriota bacterium]
MKRATIVAIAVLALAAMPVWAEQNGTFDWEDGTTTVQGSFGTNVTFENSTEQAHGGTHSLKMIESPLSGTPQGYIWWVTGLVDGDIVTASFWVHDVTPGGNPSGRIWGGYTEFNDDITSYSGSAGGNGDYSGTSEWTQLSHTWTFASDGNDDGLVVHVRLYSGTDGDYIYVDDAAITVSSDTAIVYAPDSSIVPVELMSFSIE